MTRDQIVPGLKFRVYNDKMSASGIVTKVNRTTLVYDSPYFVTSTSPDGWLRGLKIRISDMDDASEAL